VKRTIAELEAERDELESSIERLTAEDAALYTEYKKLHTELWAYTEANKNVELAKWFIEQTKQSAHLGMTMNKALEEMNQELETDTEQTYEATRLQLEHLIAVEKKVQELYELRIQYLRSTIDRIKHRLPKPA